MSRTLTPTHRDDCDHTRASKSTKLGTFALCATSLITLLLMVVGCFNDPESRLAEIRAMQAGGRFEESIQPLRVLLSAEPDNDEANYRLGIALVQTGRSSLSLWPLMKAAKSEEFGTQAGLVLASTLWAQESYEESVRAADNILKRDPDNISALHARARANVGAGKPAESLTDANRILELRSDDGPAYAVKVSALIDLRRFDEAEQAQLSLKSIAEGGTSIDKAARACGVLARFYADQEQIEKAEAVFDECLQKYPEHPLVRNWATSYYKSSDNPDAAIAIWQKAVESNPEDLELRIVLSTVLMDSERYEEAQEILTEAANLFDTAAAWQRLSIVYSKQEKFTEAREALQKALDRARVEPEVLRFSLGDLFVQEGDIESAQRIADSLKEPSYRHLLNALILLKQGKPEEALVKFDAGFRLWPNNAKARYAAGRAAGSMGDYERAIQEYREAVRVGESETDASLELARIYLALGQFNSARQFATRHRKNRPFQSADAHLIAARANAALGDNEGAAELLEKLSVLPAYRAIAVLEFAGIQRRQGGPAASSQWIENAELDLLAPENDIVLRFYLDDLLTLGRSDEALELSLEKVEVDPDDADAMELRALVLARTGRNDEAKAMAIATLEKNPEQAGALAMMGTFAAQQGNLEEALEYYDRAAAADDADGEYGYSAAKLTDALGRNEESIARLRQVAMSAPQHVGASNDLAWQLAEMETDLDLALRLSTRASLNAPSAATYDTLGWVQFKQGSTDAAVVTFEKALALEPDSPSIRYRLGLALARNGSSDEARTAFETAIKGGTFPERDAAQAELARLQGS